MIQRELVMQTFRLGIDNLEIHDILGGMSKMSEENWNIFTHVESSMNDLKAFVEDPVNQGKDLSYLNLTYDYNNLPDYSDDQIQSCYMIRNGFGYTYIYKCMYENILSDQAVRERFLDKGMEILSIGCGNRLDYLGLLYALKELDMEECTIKYTGIDLVDWKNPVEGRAGDVVIPEAHETKDIIEYLDGLDQLTADIIVFPFSIGELTDQIDFICDQIIHKETKDDFYVMTSLRRQSRPEADLPEPDAEDGPTTAVDVKQSNIIRYNLEQAGFNCEKVNEKEEEKAKDESIELPNAAGEPVGLYDEVDELLDFVRELKDNMDDENKEWNPMTRKTTVRYRIMHFTR